MTYEQAFKLQTDLNNELKKSGNIILIYSIYALWNQQAEKLYNVILYPNKYKAKYETANTSEQFSVVRVSIATQLLGAQTAEEFIVNFDEAVSKDNEANNFLNK